MGIDVYSAFGQQCLANFNHSISVNLYQQGQQNGQIDQLGSKRHRFRLRSPSMSSEIDGGGTQEHGLRLFQGMVCSHVVFVYSDLC